MVKVLMYIWFCMSYFNPTINFNMLWYIISSADIAEGL